MRERGGSEWVSVPQLRISCAIRRPPPPTASMRRGSCSSRPNSCSEEIIVRAACRRLSDSTFGTYGTYTSASLWPNQLSEESIVAPGPETSQHPSRVNNLAFVGTSQCDHVSQRHRTHGPELAGNNSDADLDVSGRQFRESQLSIPVDAQVYAQPLYASNLTSDGATFNVLFIATENDTVYAFDADRGGLPLWQVTLTDMAHGAAIRSDGGASIFGLNGLGRPCMWHHRHDW